MALDRRPSAKTADRKRLQRQTQAARSGPSHRGTITSRVDELPKPWQLSPRHGPEGDKAKPTDEVYNEAEERFAQCETWEKDSRRLFLEDLKFAEADPDNGFQWPNHMRRNRDVDRRPALTVNKARIHNLQIINDAKQNKPSISIKPTGEGASFMSAQVFESVVRDIERKSNASVAYDIATEFQVKAGIGYWTITCDFEDNETWNQSPRIRSVNDPLSIYMDPNIRERDGSDATFAFEFTDWEKSVADKKWPEAKAAGSLDVLGSGDNWLDRDHIRVATYWRKSQKKDRLIYLAHSIKGMEEGVIEKESNLKALFAEDPETLRQLLARPDTKKRKIVSDEVEWFKIIGHEIVEKGKWNGKYIPIVRLIGEETIIDGRLDRKGHTRNLKDPQRIYNYWTSAAVEHIALQSKTPWIASMESIEGYETYWTTANIVNHSYLPFNAIDDDGNKLEPPHRAEMPQFSEAYLKGMEVSGNELMFASGQFQSQMGEQENAKSGKAIGERQRQGDNATFHFPDNLDVAIRFTGIILVDMIPRVYDVKRVMMVESADGKQHELTIDPSHPESHKVQDNTRTLEAAKSIFNPTIGKYAVYADKGPNFATQRQEAADAFTKILTSWPEGINVIGDLYFRAMDFPHADEAAERIKRTIPASVLGEGPTDAETKLEQQVQQLTGMMTDATQKIAELKLREKSSLEKREIGQYQAITHRIDVLAKMMVNPADAHNLWADMMREEHASSLRQIESANADNISGGDDNPEQQGGEQQQAGSMPPPTHLPAGARQAPDGHHYLPDSSRPGKYLRVH